MARREKKSGKDRDQPKVKRTKTPRGSFSSTQKRKEARIQRAQSQQERKAAKLKARIRHLQDLLGVDSGHLDHLRPGVQHDRLRRQARLAGLVGLPLKCKKKAPQKPSEAPQEPAQEGADTGPSHAPEDVL